MHASGQLLLKGIHSVALVYTHEETFWKQLERVIIQVANIIRPLVLVAQMDLFLAMSLFPGLSM